MRVLRKVGYVKPEDLGDDNALMIDPKLGPYLIKTADLSRRITNATIDVYPITQESLQTKKVPKFNAILSEADYNNVQTKPQNSRQN